MYIAMIGVGPLYKETTKEKRERNMFNQKLIQQKIIARATNDETFRQELLKNPKAVLEHELGVIIAPEVGIQIYEDTPTTIHLVLPGKLQADDKRELSDAELGKVAGGPRGPGWMKELSETELGKVAGGPTGPDWMRQTPGLNE